MNDNDKGYGCGRHAGVQFVALRKRFCGRKNLQIARQPACDHRRVLPAGRLLNEIPFRVLWVKLIHFIVVVKQL